MLGRGSGQLSFTCTVPGVAARLLTEVRRAVADCKVTEERYLSPDVLYHWSVRKSGRVKKIAGVEYPEPTRQEEETIEQLWWRIISWLCSQGWEPYEGVTFFKLRHGDEP
jgi:hypothetical protein